MLQQSQPVHWVAFTSYYFPGILILYFSTEQWPLRCLCSHSFIKIQLKSVQCQPIDRGLVWKKEQDKNNVRKLTSTTTTNDEIWPGSDVEVLTSEKKNEPSGYTGWEFCTHSHTHTRENMSPFVRCVSLNNGRVVHEPHMWTRERINDYDKHKLHHIFPLTHSHATPLCHIIH